MKITPRLLAVSLVVALALSFVIWSQLMLYNFQVASPQWLTLVHSVPVAFSAPALRMWSWLSLIAGFGATGALLIMLSSNASSDRVLRGAGLVSAKHLAKKTRDRKAVQTRLADVSLPLACEPSHILLAGSTNTGKSTALDELLASALERGDRAIVIDPNGHALARFYKKGDCGVEPV